MAWWYLHLLPTPWTHARHSRAQALHTLHVEGRLSTVGQSMGHTVHSVDNLRPPDFTVNLESQNQFPGGRYFSTGGGFSHV